MVPQGTEVLQVKDLEIDFLKRKARRGTKRLDLSPKEFLLLWLLASHAGEILRELTFLNRYGT